MLIKIIFQKKYLEIDHNEEDENGGNELVDIGQVGSVESILEGRHFVIFSQ